MLQMFTNIYVDHQARLRHDSLTWKNSLRNHGKSEEVSQNYNEDDDGQQRVTANLQQEW